MERWRASLGLQPERAIFKQVRGNTASHVALDVLDALWGVGDSVALQRTVAGAARVAVTVTAPYGGARADGRARARVPGRGPRTCGRPRTARGRMVR